VRFEIWRLPDGTESTVLRFDDAIRRAEARDEGMAVVHEFDAVSWNEALTERNAFLGWEPYEPMRRADGTTYPEGDALVGPTNPIDELR
jgi:hypothetical protein